MRSSTYGTETHNKLIYTDCEFNNIMRHRKRIEKIRERCSRMGKRSQEVQRNHRLEHLTDLRPTTSFLVFELRTNNPTTGIQHHIEIRHEIDNGTNRYNIYLNGERWRNGWSRTRFVKWIYTQIDSVRSDWD